MCLVFFSEKREQERERKRVDFLVIVTLPLRPRLSSCSRKKPQSFPVQRFDHFQHRIRTLNGVEELDMYLHLHLMSYGGIQQGSNVISGMHHYVTACHSFYIFATELAWKIKPIMNEGHGKLCCLVWSNVVNMFTSLKYISML